MIVICEVIETVIENVEGIKIKAYGLAFYPSGCSAEPVRVIENIFLDKTKADNICDLINANDLDEIHIDDVVEDIITKVL